MYIHTHTDMIYVYIYIYMYIYVLLLVLPEVTFGRAQRATRTNRTRGKHLFNTTCLTRA